MACMYVFTLAFFFREYSNADTGDIQFEHPLGAYYKGAIFMEEGGYQKMLDTEAAQPPQHGDVSVGMHA